MSQTNVTWDGEGAADISYHPPEMRVTMARGKWEWQWAWKGHLGEDHTWQNHVEPSGINMKLQPSTF